jgi:hypothetical protein
MTVNLDIKSTSAIVVTHPGATHYTIGATMLASGLLVKDGFGQLTDDTIVLIPSGGVDPSEVFVVLRQAIQMLIYSGEVRDTA